MSGQGNDAAERSAHVTRGAAEDERMPSIHEAKDERGRLFAEAAGVARLREELEDLKRQHATDLAAARAEGAREMQQHAKRAAVEATYGPPSSWGGATPAGWYLPDRCSPRDAAMHDNGCRAAYARIAALPLPTGSDALAAVEARVREEIAAEVDCGCAARADVLARLAEAGEKRASHLCTHGDTCCALQAAAIRAQAAQQREG